MYRKLTKYFSNYIPFHIIQNILNEEDIDLSLDEIVNNKDFQTTDTEIGTYESIEELKNPQENENGGIKILDHLNETERNVPRV